MTFVSIVEHGSITHAAESMNQTTSAVSRTLSRLEEKLEVTLLRRTTRRIDLTEQGKDFLQKARDIIKAINDAEESVKLKDSAPSGVIRIDSASPFVIHSIAPYIADFSRLYPGITIELYSNERTIDLIEKKIDVAIRIGKLDDSTLHATLLGKSTLRIYAAPTYLKRYGTPKSIADLNDHKLLGFTAPRELNNWPLKTKASRFYTIKNQIAVSSGETLLHLTRHGAGISCLSDFMTVEDRKNATLVQILKDITIDEKQPIHAVYYKESQTSNKVSLFVKFLKSRMSF